ncbi:MAG: peptide-methionine (S)-S-oxide reductase MsrA [Henriciella sp.]|nr:peptide-methionine (S)-S-oxide reductase MsrA [Henriciella sp.]
MKLTHPFLIALLAGSLASITTFFMHAGAQDKPDEAPRPELETAIFAGGCFWCVEADFDKLGGVVETISGYTGGDTLNPTYKTHSQGRHLEAVKVVYDPSVVEYEELVSFFIRHIDPTDAGGQFCDRGISYTTAVFTGSLEQRVIVEAQFAAIDASNVLPAPIVTTVRDEAVFYDAEAYHQDYYLKNATRYRFYRNGCGRDKRIKAVWSGEGQS